MNTENKSSESNTECPLKFPRFEDNPVSTKTFIVMTNLTIDLAKTFEHLPVEKYIVVPKKRGRKKKASVPDPNKNIKQGSIITIALGPNTRGVVLKKKKKKEGKAQDYFRNSMTIVMIVGNKKVNFKVSRNGKFQMTGCRLDSHAEDCIKYIWLSIRNNKELYEIEGPKLQAMFVPAMRNIDFNLGFMLNRERLDEYFNNHTENPSLLETSIGYTGVNIKFPVKTPLEDILIKELEFGKEDWSRERTVSFQNYLDRLKPKDRQKKNEKTRYDTFLVFHSGKVIMSSMCEQVARNVYYEFLDIIRKNYKKFEEKLVEPGKSS